MKTYQIAANLDSYRSYANRTIKITFETNEITPETMANIHHSLYKAGYLAFSPDPFATHELEEIDKLKVEYDDTGKPASQRMRAVMYRCWEQKPDGYKIFTDYYQAQMEKLINHFKGKLEP
jgi:hypothetical protein